ncbi:EAL domain-containing protein [Arthrobacter sp. MMS24-T111]
MTFRQISFGLALGLQALIARDAAGSLLPLPPAFSQRCQSCRPVPWCLRPDIIKVDRTFIDEVVQGPDPDEPAVVSLAREVGALLVAEGIETETELTAVIAAGVTAGQGFLMGRPSVHPLDWSPWVIQPTAVSTVEP